MLVRSMEVDDTIDIILEDGRVVVLTVASIPRRNRVCIGIDAPKSIKIAPGATQVERHAVRASQMAS